MSIILAFVWFLVLLSFVNIFTLQRKVNDLVAKPKLKKRECIKKEFLRSLIGIGIALGVYVLITRGEIDYLGLIGMYIAAIIVHVIFAAIAYDISRKKLNKE